MSSATKTATSSANRLQTTKAGWWMRTKLIRSGNVEIQKIDKKSIASGIKERIAELRKLLVADAGDHHVFGNADNIYRAATHDVLTPHGLNLSAVESSQKTLLLLDDSKEHLVHGPRTSS